MTERPAEEASASQDGHNTEMDQLAASFTARMATNSPPAAPNPSLVTDSDHDSDEREPQVDIQPGRSTEVKYEKRYHLAFYEIKDLGSGAYGSVVAAKNKTDEKVYAVKKVLKEPDDDLSMEKMYKEVKVLARLSHPNVVEYKQAWVEEATEADIKRYSRCGGSSESSEATGDGSAADGMVGSPSGEIRVRDVSKVKGSYSLLYIQMELCKGSLDDKLYKPPESWVMNREGRFGTDSWAKAVLEIIKQLLRALEYIHSENIVHTDVKPKNILYDEERRVAKLGDFGLATHARKDVPSRDGSEASLPSKVQGRLYEAPEQLCGTLIDSKVDIYSLGVVLAELLCLFTTVQERYEKLPKLRSGNSPTALEEYSTRGTDVARLVSAMCQRRPNLRPTAKDLLHSGMVVTKDTVIRGLKAELEDKDHQIFLLMRYVLHMEEKMASETGTTET